MAILNVISQFLVLHSDKSLQSSASQMLLLIRILPLIFLLVIKFQNMTSLDLFATSEEDCGHCFGVLLYLKHFVHH